MNYRTDKFEALYHGQNGQQLWDFLREHDSLLRMESATYLGRPAVEALSRDFKRSFPSLAAQHRGRQMMGHMVRQVMEADGYRLMRSNVKIKTPDSIFRRGSVFIL